MGVVAIIVFGVMAFGAQLALVPVHREPFGGFAFTFGFLNAELSGQILVLDLVLLGLFGSMGWLHGGLGTVAIILSILVAIAFAYLTVVALRAGRVVLEALRSARGVRIESFLPIEGGWLRWWRTCIAFPFRGRGIEVHRDIDYVGDASKSHMLDVIVRREPVDGAPVLLFVHGGAWTVGSKREQCLPMLFELATRGWVCVSINYRLSPKATWPDHIIDVKHSIAWVKEHIGEFGGDPERFLTICGDSAGGHLAALSALTPNDPVWQPGFEDADTSVDACVSLYGVLDMTGDRSMMGLHGNALTNLLARAVMRVHVQDAPDVYEASSPYHRLHPEAPAFLVLQGTNDTLVTVETARQFVDQFKRQSSAPIGYFELPLAQHAFDTVCSPRCTATTRGIATFLNALVNARESKPAG
jgi:acetyl esterase/lipase